MNSNNPDKFDIIILGAGTAGSLLASRLSTNPTLRILILEAGRNLNSDPNVSTPGFASRLLGDPKYDWQFQTEPEEGLNGRVIKQPRGRLWGGSSAINSHVLAYPSREYHNAWDRLLGDGDGKEREKWDWEGVGRYYREFQNLQVPSEEVRRELAIGDFVCEGENVGGGEREKDESGGVQASYTVTPPVLQKTWVDAIQEFGYNSSENPVDGNVIGGSVTPNAIDSCRGERSHAGVALLEPATERKNLVVRSNVLVKNIVFDEKKQNGKLIATGVRYRDEESGANVTVYACREVIICAGTFGSPKILELSGIGQRERLNTEGIECRYDLQGVGENLQDHLNFGPSVEVHDHIETLDIVGRDPAVAEARKRLYEISRAGPLADPALNFSYLPLQNDPELTALLKKHVDETRNKSLKAQYSLIAHQILNPREATATVFMTRMQRYTPPSDPAPGNYMSIIAMLSHPFSRGASHITSTNPQAHPKIKFNYLHHPLDTEILARHILQINILLTLPALSSKLKPNGNTLPPNYPRSPDATTEDVAPFLKQYAATNYHPVGTCAMMAEELDGVVDAELRVYGTGNVRVVDASVVPVVPRGNVLSTVYAVAGKGADVVLKALWG